VKPKNLYAAAAVLALAVGVGLLTPSGTAHAQPPLVPHYECYDLLPTGPPAIFPPVTLETQFGVEEVGLGPMPVRLCLPALKNGEGDLNVPHVECLPIAGDAPDKVVTLTTQFGVQRDVRVGPPISMCMPATKAISPQEPQGPPPLVPHYECYEISGEAPDVTPVAIQTQFGTHQGVVVGEPTRLCLPALKNGEGSLQAPHVECFQILADPPGPPPVLVNLWTQFGLQTPWIVGPAVELCVPALKEVVPPTPIPAGQYQVVIDCDGFYAGAASLTLTLNNNDVKTFPLSLNCSPGGQARQTFKAPSDWNDSKLNYWCSSTKPTTPPPPPPLNTLDIRVPPRVDLDKWYALQCPSTGIGHPPSPTPTPTGTPPPEPPIPTVIPTAAPGVPRVQIDRVPVGGIAEVAGAEAAALGATDSGGSSGTTYAVIAGIAGVALLGAGGWYARRRWLS